MSRRPDRSAATPPVRCLPNCTGCGTCLAACPVRALSLCSEYPDGRGRKAVAIAASRCNGCGTCVPACPRGALALIAATR